MFLLIQLAPASASASAPALDEPVLCKQTNKQKVLVTIVKSSNNYDYVQNQTMECYLHAYLLKRLI